MNKISPYIRRGAQTIVLTVVSAGHDHWAFEILKKVED